MPAPQSGVPADGWASRVPARFYAGLAISAVCTALALQGISLEGVRDALWHVQPLWLLASIFFFIASYLARTARWQMLFRPRRVTFSNTLSALSIGYLLSNLLPARLGDVARAVLLGWRENISRANALATVLVERVSDGIMVGALLLTLLVVAAPVSDDARAVGVLAVAGGATTLIVLGALSAHVGTLRQRLNERLVRHTLLGRMWPIFASAAEGLAGLRSARALAALSGWSVAVWTLNTLSYWTMLLALDLSLPLTAAMLIIVVTGLVAIVPSSPGYIGVFHFTIQQTLVQAYRVEPSIGLSYALLIHAVTYLGTTILGLLFLWREGLSLRNVAV